MDDNKAPDASSINLKDIEVSAKEIVDRISNHQTAEPQPEKSRQSNPPGMSKLLSGIEHIDEEQLKLAVSANQGRNENFLANHVQQSDDHQQTAEQKGVEQLLAAVEKWVKEAQLVAEGNGAVQGGARGLENMHWVYSIESYLRSLDTDWTSQKALTHKICSQLLVWLKQLFHFKESGKDEQDFNSVHPHWDINGGMVAVTQLNLYLSFPKLFNTGYPHFQEQSKSPLIYCSDEIVGQQTSCRLGLPYSCVSTVDITDKDWVGLLERKIQSDKKKGLVPIALLLTTNASNIDKAVKLAESQKIWVHFYGANVTAYFLKRPESNQLGNSFTIDLTRWFRTPKVPYLTIYKRPEETQVPILELCDLGSPRNEIMCFTPWFVAHVFGRPQLTALVNEAIHRGRFLLEMVQRYECLHLVPNWSTLSDGTVIVQALTFQYNPPQYVRRNRSDLVVGNVEKEETEHSDAYVDTLNSWLYHIMERDMKGLLPVEFVFVESAGWNIHIDVIRCQKHQPDEEATIISIFENHLQVLQATVMQKVKFCKLVKEADELEWVDHETQWAGLGAVRYIPMFHRAAKENSDSGKANPLSKPDLSTASGQNTLDIKENVDHLNAKIVDKLKAIDTAFSLGEAATGEWCVQFGMVTEETDVKELVRLVIATGQDIEESSEFFNRMSELVKKGIEKATEELRKESEEALWEEGILRRVPVVGTFVNWFSPPTKESGVRGRALNLTQGKVESTENIYKYHMQVEAASINSANKANTSTHANNVNKAKE